MGQHANSSGPGIVMTLEREVHFFNAVPFGGGSKSRLRPIGCSTEQNAFFGLHLSSSLISP
jgi:hypothetical protein